MFRGLCFSVFRENYWDSFEFLPEGRYLELRPINGAGAEGLCGNKQNNWSSVTYLRDKNIKFENPFILILDENHNKSKNLYKKAFCIKFLCFLSHFGLVQADLVYYHSIIVKVLFCNSHSLSFWIYFFISSEILTVCVHFEKREYL